MFKYFIEKVIAFLGKSYFKLNTAYNETYSDKKVGQEAIKEIERRKEANRLNFIRQQAMAIGMYNIMQGKPAPPPKEALLEAQAIFEHAKKRGHVDELNNLKDSSEWS